MEPLLTSSVTRQELETLPKWAWDVIHTCRLNSEMWQTVAKQQKAEIANFFDPRHETQKRNRTASNSNRPIGKAASSKLQQQLQTTLIRTLVLDWKTNPCIGDPFLPKQIQYQCLIFYLWESVSSTDKNRFQSREKEVLPNKKGVTPLGGGGWRLHETHPPFGDNDGQKSSFGRCAGRLDRRLGVWPDLGTESCSPQAFGGHAGCR